MGYIGAIWGLYGERFTTAWSDVVGTPYIVRSPALETLDAISENGGLEM